MKVAIFGGTGFVGKYLLKSLINHNHEIYTLVRNGSENKINDFAYSQRTLQSNSKRVINLLGK